MRNSCLSLFLGLTATAVVLTPITVEAQSFDYNRLENFSVRPIESNDILYLFGDPSQNEGYVVFSNEDPNAPDAGHIGLRPDAFRTSYYTAGRENSPDPSGATRSATLENITGFSNFFNYLNSNNIPLSSIGYGYGPKSDQDLTKTWNLGEDKLGQDWFGSPDSLIEEDLYRANPNDVETYLSYGTTKLITFGYIDVNFISVDDNPGTLGTNIFLSEPSPAFKEAGLDPLASGLADAFLRDVAAGGGLVQQLSEDQPQLSDLSFSASQGYQVINLPLPLELRAVPEPSSTLGLLACGAMGAVFYLKKQQNTRKSSS